MPDPKSCECGCGDPAPTARETNRRKGHVKGQPLRFIHGHRVRLDSRSLADRFAEKVALATDLSPNGMTGCLLWTGSDNGCGYGTLSNASGSRYAHIIAWLLAGRVIPAGQQLDHRCRRTLCTNVDHLEPVTSGENTRRGTLAKLSAPQVLEIRELRRQGWSGPWIAAAYGVSSGHVSKIEHRRVWVDV